MKMSPNLDQESLKNDQTDWENFTYEDNNAVTGNAIMEMDQS